MQGRTLTAREIHEARTVFRDRIDYQRPRIFATRHPLAVRRNQVLAPDGNIYWPGAADNLAKEDDMPMLSTFIHEMAHVMQYQHGVNVLANGFGLHAARILSFRRYDPYEYRFDAGKPYKSYNIEQQAEIAVGIHLQWYPNIIDYAEIPPTRLR